MSETFDCSESDALLAGMRRARAALGRGELVVLPTDTVYGVAADAFTPRAVAALLAAKGRGRQAPPPVLIPDLPTLDALAQNVPDEVRRLVSEFWPGGLTVVLPARPSLAWDLGETRGTVALRMPDDTIALEILKETGPLAVSSANLTGEPAAGSAAEAEGMLGESVAVYLEAGHRPARQGDSVVEQASTIIDATALAAGDGGIRILRHGAVSDDRIRAIVGDLLEEPADP
ncbi:MAG TPA: L-threonylcarbamoyladenylate synthase [Microbacteriaceae bacterium]|nr:L-threonylcarbamoyladenylate synthase [Microbacteriaceae bacterium]